MGKKGRWEETNDGSGQRRGELCERGAALQVTGNGIEKQIIRVLSYCCELSSFALIFYRTLFEEVTSF